MSTINWNCHGLGSSWTIQELLDLVSLMKPCFVFLMEVKIRRSRVEQIKIRMGFQGLFYVDNVGTSGGLALCG